MAITMLQNRFVLPLFCGITVSIVACTQGPDKGTVLRTTDYVVTPYTVTEEVQHVSTDWFDDTLYQRVYIAKLNGQALKSFTGPETYWSVDAQLASSPPKIVGDRLAIFSLDQVWIWHPEQDRVVTFEPILSLEDDVWKATNTARPLNWSHAASDFRIDENQWILEYTNEAQGGETSSAEDKYYFVSTDQGQTFVPASTPL